MSLNIGPGSRQITTDKGIPREKIRFCIEPVQDDAELIAEALKNMQSTGASDPKGTCIKGALKTKLDELLKQTPSARKTDKTKLAALDAEIKKVSTKANLNNLPDLFRAYRQVNQRVIGKALGQAKRGDRVEVLLQPRHAY